MSAFMEIVVRGLRASVPLRLPFGRRLDARAFVLERGERGNCCSTAPPRWSPTWPRSRRWAG